MSYGYQDPYGAPQDNQSYQGYQNYQPAQPYAANPYAGQAGGVQAYNPYVVATLPDHPQATTVLVLGILSIVAFQICGPFAWYFGSKARKEIRENPGVYKEGGTLTAGWVMGIIGTVLLGFWILYFIFMIVLMIIGMSYGSR